MRLIDADRLKEDIAKGDIVIDEEILKCETIHDILLYLLKKVDDLMITNIDKQPTIEPMTYYKQNKEKLKQYSRDVYYWRKANGICTRCGKEKSIKNNLYCPICREENRLRAEAYRKKKKINCKK